MSSTISHLGLAFLKSVNVVLRHKLPLILLVGPEVVDMVTHAADVGNLVFAVGSCQHIGASSLRTQVEL